MNGLPACFSSRSAALEDGAAVAGLWNRRAGLSGRESPYEAADVKHRWSTPGFDPSTDTFLVFREDGRLAAYAHLRDVKDPHVDLFVGVSVDPDSEDDDSLWGAAFDWLDARGRQSVPRAPEGARVVLIAGAADGEEKTQEVLRCHGFELQRTFHRLRHDFAGPPEDAAWPTGLSARGFRPGQDDAALVAATREAFKDHYGHLEQPFEAELARLRHTMTEDDFDERLWFLAVHRDEVCGFCLTYAEAQGDKETGLVDELGVTPAWRRRGIGRALLLHAFCALYDRGLKGVELTVDSDNSAGALDLYEGVGMRPVRRSHTFVKELRPGRNLVVE